MEVNQGTSGIVITFNEYELNQHDLEIRADERKKVCEELREWYYNKLKEVILDLNGNQRAKKYKGER